MRSVLSIACIFFLTSCGESGETGNAEQISIPDEQTKVTELDELVQATDSQVIQMAEETCECMNRGFVGIDEDVKRLFIDASELPDGISFRQYTASLDSTLQLKLMLTMMNLGASENSTDHCLVNYEQNHADLEFPDDAVFLEAMRNVPGCEVAYAMMKIGLEASE